jgi:PAS domain S-box-containing protein
VIDMTDRTISILLVEDEEAHAELIRRAFEPHGVKFSLTVASSVEQAKRALAELTPDLIVADFLLPDGVGTELLSDAPQEPAFPLVIVTSHGNEQVAVEAIKSGALDYVVKSHEALADMPRIAERSLREWRLMIEKRQTEQALEESEAKFRQLAESIQDVFWLANPGVDGEIIYYSPAFERVWGIKPREGDPSPSIIQNSLHGLDRDRVLDAYEEFTKGAQDFNVEYRIIRPDGSIRWIWDRAFPIRDNDGKLCRVAGLAQDITQRKLDQQRQQELIEEIRRFAYIVSHDLRAPLVNVRGFSKEIEAALDVIRPAFKAAKEAIPEADRGRVRQAIDDDLPEALEFIKSSVLRMDSLISAILKLSRLGRAELHFEPLDMNELVGEALRTLDSLVKERGAIVLVGDLPAATADRISMDSIFVNIIGNALNYLDRERPGEVEITGVRRFDETIYSFKDNGVGVDEQDIGEIFEVFRRAGKQDVPGEGMGLAYVKMLARRHGGRVWCESQPGKGSVFYLAIPNDLAGEATSPNL